MNFEDRGKYITILCSMHQHGRLSEESIRFLVGSISDMLKSKFKIDENGLYYNERLETEMQKRSNFVISRKLNGSKGGRPKDSNKPSGLPSVNRVVNLAENENRNENKDSNEDKSEVYLRFDHLSITVNKYNKLCELYQKSDVDDILDRIRNYRKNTSYKDLYLTACNWLKKDGKKPLQHKEEIPTAMTPAEMFKRGIKDFG
jgi:hypothetical protein